MNSELVKINDYYVGNKFIDGIQIKRVMKINIKYIVMLISIIHKQKRKCVLLKKNG
jgi:hypothetical protein